MWPLSVIYVSALIEKKKSDVKPINSRLNILNIAEFMASIARKCLIDTGKLDSRMAKVILTESTRYLNLTDSH